MASTVVVRGLLRIGQQASESAGYDAAREIQVMAIDDSTVAFAQSHTTLGTGGAVPTEFDQTFDAAPSTATDTTSATITHVATFGTAITGITVRRVSLHDTTSTSVTTSSVSLVAGIDAQSLLKTTDFTLELTVRLKYVVCTS